MFDKDILKRVLENYKRDLPGRWKGEVFKWQAIKCFQDNWDINAQDFPQMLERSLEKTENLLASNKYFPKRMIIEFAQLAPDKVRNMFAELFDESKDVYDRINAFKAQSAVLLKLKKHKSDTAQHFQTENSISVYLWLRYPDKYYIYKFSEVRSAAETLKADFSIKTGAYAENIRNFLRLYDELSEAVKEDDELVKLFKSLLTDDCYPDPQLKTLAIDVGFYISKMDKAGVEIDEGKTNNNENPQYWLYAPGENACMWDECVKEGIIAIGWDKLGNYRQYGSKQEIAQALGNTQSMSALAVWQFLNEMKTGDIVFAKKGLYLVLGRGVVESEYIYDASRERYKHVRRVKWTDIAENPYPGQATQKTLTDITDKKDVVDKLNNLYDKGEVSAVNPVDNENPQYWWLNANPKIWSYSNIAIGETQSYTLYNENGNKRRIFQNFLNAKAGDLIIGYESNPVKQIVALGRVTGQNGKELFFEKSESLASPIDYATLKNCSELENMEYFKNPQGSFFALTKDEYDFILDIIREENPTTTAVSVDKYTKQNFLDEVYMTDENYKSLVSVLRNKMNIILQGAPGVGKTFAARRLAWSIMGEQDDNRIEFVQFHQSYSYEDFVMGYKPVEDSFQLKYGVFYRFCKKAENQPDKDFFFIIDEINRGNLSKIFGELLMLIEKDYRGTKAVLAYDERPFSVPKNLYIIGMMNTADRSLAMIDYALRRRFGFFEMEPGFDSKGFVEYQNSLNSETFDKLISKIKELNNAITNDKSLGKGFCIGHSYFCNRDVCDDEWLHSVVDYDIIPTLREYWFDNTAELQRWESILQGVFK